MPQFTIQSAALKEQKDIDGQMCIYTLLVTDPTGQQIQCELLQRPDTPIPQQGQQVEGDMRPSSNPAKYPPTLKKAKPAGGGGGGGRGFDSPETIARISRSHAQEMALRFYEATGAGKLDWKGDADQEKVRVQLGHVKRLTDWFDADVKAAAEHVAQQQPAQQTPPPQQQQAPPPQQQAPPPQAETPPPPSDDDIPF